MRARNFTESQEPRAKSQSRGGHLSLLKLKHPAIEDPFPKFAHSPLDQILHPTMPLSDEDNQRQKGQDDVNPFILFRRFADQQMSNLMRGVFTISSFASPSSSPHRSVEDYEKWLHEAREPSQRLAREAEEAGRIMDVYTRAHQEAHRVVQESASENESEPLRCPYRPFEQEDFWPEKPSPNTCLMDEANRSSLSLATLSLGLPRTSLTAAVLGEQLSSVPVAYLLYSPYSPFRLEQQPRLCDHGAKSREAFEDLLAVQSGPGLLPKCSQRTSESSVDCMPKSFVDCMVKAISNLETWSREEDIDGSSSAVCKTSDAMNQDPGFLSPIISPTKPESDADEDEDADDDGLVDDGDAKLTELSMYDRVLGSQQPPLNGTAKGAIGSFAHLQQDTSLSNTACKTPSILSTLTTTERTTLQDGSVHTKVVLKKSFSDGREESTETVHHQNAVRQIQDAASESIKDEAGRKTGKDEEKTKNRSSGWFWS